MKILRITDFILETERGWRLCAQWQASVPLSHDTPRVRLGDGLPEVCIWGPLLISQAQTWLLRLRGSQHVLHCVCPSEGFQSRVFRMC